MGAEFPDMPEFRGHPHDQWNGAVAAPSGKVYGIPDESLDILIVDPVNNVATRDAMGADIGTNVKKFNGGVYCPDTGLIYGVPYMSTAGVLIIDDAAQEAWVQDYPGIDWPGEQAWRGAVLAPNGRIFTIPQKGSQVLIIDPVSESARLVTLAGDTWSTGGDAWWSGGALGADGRIYCTPYTGSQVLIIDPDTESAELTDFGLDLAMGEWGGAVAGPDGLIYMCPWGNDTAFGGAGLATILIIDPEAGTAVLDNMGATFPSVQGRWQSGAVGADGRIYFVPRSDQKLLVVDTVTQTASREDYGTDMQGSSKWHSCALALNGDIIGMPQDAPDILTISTTAPALPEWLTLGPVLNKL